MSTITALLAFAATVSGAALHKRAAVNDCLTTAKVPVYASGSSQLTQALKPFNLRLTYKPVAYAVPTTPDEVAAAVKCGVDNSVIVTPKSGGHSYASHGLGGEDGHMIVDMKNFNKVTVDTASESAMVGPAGRLGNVAQQLYNSKKAIVHGTCPGVGVAGLTLHGGYGLSSHGRGLSLDNILEAQVVLANSTIVTASDTQNPDLFWALRGAGAAFGIVTNFKFKTFTPPESNIVFQYGVNIGSASQMATVISALQDFTQNSQPAELNLRFFINRSGNTLQGVYYGSQSAFNSAMQPLLSKIGNPYAQAQTMGWIQTLSNYAYGPLQQSDPYDTHETFFSKSLMPANLSSDAVNALATYWANTARNNNRDWYLMIDCHGGVNSAIAKVAPDATSYAHRNATFKMQFYDRISNGGTYDPSWQSFLNGWVNGIMATMPTVNFGMYINYADSSLSKEDAHKHYWLNHYDRLLTIKKALDPKNVFSGPQIVGS